MSAVTEKQALLPSSHPPPYSQPDQANHDEEQAQPTLAQLQQNIRHAQREYIKAWSRSTSGRWHRRIIFGVTGFVMLFTVFMMTIIAQDSLLDDTDDDWFGRGGGGGRVALEAHVMSKCPDARDCLHDLILPAMMKIGDRVDFKLSFIGNVTEDGSVACKHGDDECLGNIIELCAQKEYPNPRVYLGFTMCLTRDYQLIPQRELLENCALEHGIDVEKLNSCSTDKDGYLSVDALKASFNRTASAGITTSCTIRLNNQVRCVRDDGEWKDCPDGHEVKDLVRDVLAYDM